MATDTLKLLEFGELLSLLENYAGSPLGKGKLLSLVPSQDRAAIAARLELAAEARDYLRSSAGAPGAQPRSSGSTVPPLRFSGFTDPGLILSKLAVEGAVLEIPEIAELLEFADRALEIRRTLLGVRGRFPQLGEEAERSGDFQALLRELRGKILPSGELDDRASPELQRIRREMVRQRAAIFSLLRSILRAETEETRRQESLRQEEIITIRGERFVVPVRVQRKSAVKGVIHGSSSSGQTVYVEPLETIDLNNELVRLKEEEQREIFRILQQMTLRLREEAAELAETAEAMGVLDLAFACGRYALDYHCVIPRFHGGSGPAQLSLKEARHPLLEALYRKRGAGVVPLSLTLGGEDRVLVLSGPNTGGKTVALKCIGLLALMAMAGLPVPAADAEFPLFDRILADIGDSQSIQENLSTFSAHLLNIASMMEAATPESLILLDELGTATDPEEAGALGVAVVDRFRSAGSFMIASTHHMALKAYATHTPGVLSANMGFDEQTLEPTYRLEMGLPGQSSGLAIAERLGLPGEVIAHARRALSSAHRELEDLLSRLREGQSACARLRAELEEKSSAQERREREWMETVHRREAERAAEWERQLETLWRSFEERAEEKLREIASRPALRSPGAAGAAKPSRATDCKKEAARATTRLRQQAGEELRQSLVSQLGGSGEGLSAPTAPSRSPQEAGVGDSVRLRSLGTLGVVRSRTDNWLEVEVGRLRTRVSLEDVAEVMPATERGKPSVPSGVSVRVEAVPEGSLSEINVIGETAEEARRRVDKFLDQASLAQLSRVRVVHGSGKGILRQALAEMFAEHPHVEKFFPAPQNEGGAGATIVELKT